MRLRADGGHVGRCALRENEPSGTAQAVPGLIVTADMLVPGAGLRGVPERPRLRDRVVICELVHLVYRGQGARLWALVAAVTT